MPETREPAPPAIAVAATPPQAKAPMDRERAELMELLRLHSEEVRFTVQLNWDRAKSSLVFHVALLAVVGALHQAVLSRALATGLFLFTGISAAVSAVMLGIGHGYYRAARDRRAEVENRLGVPVRFGTTRTMRGERQEGPARFWPKVTTIVIAQLILLAALAFAAAAINLT